MKKEIVYTDQYALILTGEEIKEGDYRLNIQRNTIHFVDEEPSYFNKRNDVFKKVIAHLPLSDAPILKGVPLLPSFSWGQQDDVELIAKQEAEKLHDKSKHEDWDIYDSLIYEDAETIKIGYNKAKEKYKYTEESMLKAVFLAAHDKLGSFEIIQSLQEPSRPTHFECEMEVIGITDDGFCTIEEHKTITNSQGHVELVGKYLNL